MFPKVASPMRLQCLPVDSRLSRIGYRKCVLRRYLFIYRVDEAAGVIHVIRYFHELQDYWSKL